MSLIKCPECETEFDNALKSCPKCGCPVEVTHKNKTKVGNPKLNFLKNIEVFLFIVIMVFAIISSVFFYKGYKVKNEYYNSETYTTLNKNAYVGGDAYNYIINGTYFTGYSVIATGALLCAMISVGNVIYVHIKIKECK